MKNCLDMNHNVSDMKQDVNIDVYMRVILIEQYGILHTNRLPDTKEGRYQFWYDSCEDSSLPVYIEGKFCNKVLLLPNKDG